MSSDPSSLDEMIFAISQVNFCSIYRETSPPPPSSSLLFAAVEDATATSVAEGPVNSAGSVLDDIGATVDSDNDDSEDEEEAVEEKLEGSRSDPAEHVKPSKHLILLDLIALLLITEPKSDVAATMLAIRPAPIFYYSKSRPLTEDENRYVHKLFNLARHPTMTPQIRKAALRTEVIDKCRKKIMARIKNVLQRLKSLKNVANYGINRDDHLATEARKKLRCRLPIEPDVTLQSFIVNWLEWLRLAQSPPQLDFAISMAYLIGSSEEMRSMVDFQLFRRIRKVGDYASAPIVLLSVIDRLSQQQRDELTIQEVSAQQPRTVTINKTCVEVFDQWSRLKTERGVSEGDVRLQYPSLRQPLSRSNKVTLSVHCECTLVSAIVSRYLQNRMPIDVEIGVSKSLCAWCGAFMGIVRKQYPAISIMTTSRYGKNVAGWTIPPLAPQGLIDDMQSSVEALVQDICAKVNQMRRSDSEPRTADITEEHREDVLTMVGSSEFLEQLRRPKDLEV